MPPPQKKRRTAAEEEPQPVVIPSSSSPERQENQASAPTKDEIKAMLCKLRDSKTASDAEDAMEALDGAVDEKKSTAKSAAKLIVEQHGVGMILIALTKWYKEKKEVAKFAISSLLNITFYQKSSKEQVAALGISQILATASRYSDDMCIQQYTVALLGNLANISIEETILEVATDECIDLVMETMKKSEHPYTQRVGVSYLRNIGDTANIKERVKQANILSVLGNAADISRKGTKKDYESASKAVKMYI